jgi:hypothetical protein
MRLIPIQQNNSPFFLAYSHHCPPNHFTYASCPLRAAIHREVLERASLYQNVTHPDALNPGNFRSGETGLFDD